MYSFDADLIKPWIEKEINDEILGRDVRCIGQIDSNKELIAAVAYSGFNEAQMIMSLAIKKAPSRKFFAIMFDYPFNRAPVNRLTAFIRSDNEKSINLAQRCGFVLESTMKQAIPDADMLVFRLFKDECRFLDQKYQKMLR